ncbi:MAG: YdcF family protein [Pseudomonadota bacterium]
MSLSWFLTNLVAALLLPPLNLLVVGGLGLALRRCRPRLGMGLVVASLAGLWLLATPIVAGGLLDSLEPAPAILDGREADAIVILGGGRNRGSIEYGGDTVKHFTLERLRYGAFLARRLNKPILVTGGAPEGVGTPEGRIMRDVLEEEYRLPVRWVEDASRNTRENAEFSAAILKQAGVRRIYLVSHAWHLARAIPEFERAGLAVVPAGTGYTLSGNLEPFDFIPNAQALLNSYLASHEWLGQLWYRLRN